MAQDHSREEAVPLFRRPIRRPDSRYFPMQAFRGARGYHGEAFHTGAPLQMFPFNLAPQINEIADEYVPNDIDSPEFIVELLVLFVNWLTAAKYTLTDDESRYAYDCGVSMDPHNPFRDSITAH